MIEILFEHAAAMLLCFGLACVGAALARERPEGLIAWNRAFMVGVSAASASLFPLSLLLPHRAVTATLGLIGAAVAYWAIDSKRHSGAAGSDSRWPVWNAYERIALGIILGFVLVFGVVNACFPLGWDGFQIWTTKGLVLHHQGGLTPTLWPPSPTTDITRVVQYPPMVPLLTALLASVRGEFNWAGSKPLFFAFYLSMLISIFDVSQRTLPRRLALAAVLVTALLPVQFDLSTAGGYADMPLAALLVATVTAISRYDSSKEPLRSPFLWTMAGLLMVKNEGLILFGIIVVIGAIILGGRRRQYWKLGAGLGGALALRIGYLWWTESKDVVFRFDFVRAYHRMFQLPGLVAPWLVRWTDWGLYWPAALLACVTLLLIGRTMERAVAAGLMLGLAAYSSLYLFTNWDMALHISNSMPRLLQDFIPIASVIMATAYGRLTGIATDP